MRFLFVHQNFPGQYRHLAPYLAKLGHEVVAIGEYRNMRRQAPLDGVRLYGYELSPRGAGDFPHDGPLYSALHRGRAVAAAAAKLARQGFRPDLMFAHIGWGEGIFLKDVFPAAKLQLYCEFFYRAAGSDVGFDSEFPPTSDTPLRLRMKNAPLLMALDASDRGISPTSWQCQQFPAGFRDRIDVVHDGIDTDVVKPDPNACFRLPGSGITLTAADQVVTYVARNLEPYRGFHTFMRAVPEIQRRWPKAAIVIVGGDDVSYSPRLPNGETYRAKAERELGGAIDRSRLFFTGRIPYADYLSLLQVSSAHVYLTYPFVLSWSMLEAMAAGCLVVGSRTPPVEEVITHGQNGLLADFFSSADIAEKVGEALSHPPGASSIRSRARQTVQERYDLKRVCLPAHLRLIERFGLFKDTAPAGYLPDAVAA